MQLVLGGRQRRPTVGRLHTRFCWKSLLILGASLRDWSGYGVQCGCQQQIENFSWPPSSGGVEVGAPCPATGFRRGTVRRDAFNTMPPTMPKQAVARCAWCGTDPVYVAYHDTEWGVPELDDHALYEKLVLDGVQAGLSWITVLKKRDAFRKAFKGFDPHKVARFTSADVDRLLTNPGIIRSKAKINAAIKNAQAWCHIMDDGSGAFRDLLWSAVDHRTIDMKRKRDGDIVTQSPASVDLAKRLKKRGFAFCGPVILYAFMQAVGMYNEHLVSCPRHKACARLARK